MKNIMSSAASEFAKRILYSFQVLVIGVFIPFLFMIGINTNLGATSGNETSISKPHQEIAPKAIVDNTVFLSYQHS